MRLRRLLRNSLQRIGALVPVALAVAHPCRGRGRRRGSGSRGGSGSSASRDRGKGRGDDGSGRGQRLGSNGNGSSRSRSRRFSSSSVALIAAPRGFPLLLLLLLLELALQRAPVGDVLQVPRADPAACGAAGALGRARLRPPLEESYLRGIDYVRLHPVERAWGQLVEVRDLDDVCGVEKREKENKKKKRGSL